MNKAIKGSNRKLGTVAPATPLKKKKFELERKTIWVPVKDLTPNVDTVNAKPPFEVRLKVSCLATCSQTSFAKLFALGHCIWQLSSVS